MIVDLLRNDLGGICEVDTARAPELMRVEQHRTVRQLISTITGVLETQRTLLQCARCASPAVRFLARRSCAR
jgi:para-aminobenzoate synthetase